MKIRQAKKILFAKHWVKRYEKLRPLYIDESSGRLVHPSWHNIGIRSFQKARAKFYSYNIRYTHKLNKLNNASAD